VSPYEKKKSKATITGTTQFLSRIARGLMTHTIDLAEHKKSGKKAEAITVKIKKPTKGEYKNVPKNMCQADFYALLKNYGSSRLVLKGCMIGTCGYL
jgi:hypothetical protein